MSCVASGRPAPRYAPMVVLFVSTVDGLEPHLRDLVHADRHHLREHRQDGADRRVRAGRRHDRTVEADDLAVGADAEPGRHHEVAAVHERDHVLGAGRDPLHRPAELQRRRARRRGARRTAPPSGRSRRRPTGTRRAASRARGRASARTPPWIECGAWCETQQREAAVGRARRGCRWSPSGRRRAAGSPSSPRRRRRRPRAGRSRRPRGTSVPKQTLEPCSGNSSGASGAIASAAVMTAGSGS